MSECKNRLVPIAPCLCGDPPEVVDMSDPHAPQSYCRECATELFGKFAVWRALDE